MKCMKVELRTNVCGDSGVMVEVVTTFLGQNISSNSIFIPYQKSGGNNV